MNPGMFDVDLDQPTSPHAPGLTFTVYGTPTPQGSKKGYVVKGRAVVVDDNKAPLRTWRNDVVTAARDAVFTGGRTYPDGPIHLAVVFYLPRPKAHYGTRAGVAYLKASAPVWVDKKPDGDKLLRSVCDALTTAGVYRDDAQIAGYAVQKRYAGGRHAELDRPGAVVHVAPIGGSF